MNAETAQQPKTYEFKTELFPGGNKVQITKYLFIGKDKRYRYDLIDAENGEPIATCNLNMPGQLENNEVAIKDYSENEGMLRFMVINNLVEKPHNYIPSGHVEIPICKLKDLQYV